ncbi:glycoside hydrolase family 25 protein [Pseudohoeflea coraliihabitans]|uniref:Glycoside hydrolase family 25 protein n=1 Tax=Pseudohoeflea coraliihabitans TaxID=2860393 RepID=A0ABS6WP69_9HYPH|nr:GH25 family lysozyme [Pseudohoeflea sp. DP4N28-3]MBW3096869.1 glycoside hydrolase family 25 protein [Pseudohoeflea sp. DP4N28-3]
MRTPLISLSVLTLLVPIVAGCNSSGVDALKISKSAAIDKTTTASVRPIVPPGTLNETAKEGGRDEARGLGYANTARPVEMAVLRANKPALQGRSDAPTIYKARFSDAKPIDFGQLSPAGFAVHGVDVSRWQGKIDWTALRQRGANFAFIKATDGGDHLDPNFHRNWTAAREAGVARGAYHFFYWCRTASSQADWFIRNVPKEKGALPPVIDVEWNHTSKTCRKYPSPEMVRKKMQVFMDRLEAHYGQRPIIYTAPDFYDDNLKGAFPNHPFWLRAVAEHPSKVYPGRDFLFWQYSGTGLAADHPTQIDLNVFNGSAAGWHKWLQANRL